MLVSGITSCCLAVLPLGTNLDAHKAGHPMLSNCNLPRLYFMAGVLEDRGERHKDVYADLYCFFGTGQSALYLEGVVAFLLYNYSPSNFKI